MRTKQNNDDVANVDYKEQNAEKNATIRTNAENHLALSVSLSTSAYGHHQTSPFKVLTDFDKGNNSNNNKCMF